MVTYPKDWEMLPLYQICQPNGLVRGPFGGSLKKEDFVQSGIKVYEQKNAIQHDSNMGSYYISKEKYDTMRRFTVYPGDFIISCSGTIGKIYCMPKDSVIGIINQALLKISIDESIIIPSYFKYIFESSQIQETIVDSTQGGAMKNLVGMEQFRETLIPVPLLKEQTLISTILDVIDNHIANLTELIEKKKGIRDGALEDLMSGRIRLGGYQQGWITIPFGEYFTLLGNNTYSREQLSEHGTMGNIHYGDILVKYGNIVSERDEIPRIKEGVPFSEKWLLQETDILIADTAEDETVGKAIQIGRISYPIVGGLHTIVCRPNMKTASGFLGYYINSKSFHDQLLPHITGIKVSSVSKKAIKTTELRIPSAVEEQEAITGVLVSMDDEISAIEDERDKMIQIREGAMDDLLTGRIRLSI